MTKGLAAIKAEFESLKNDPLSAMGIDIGLANDDDYYNWRVIMMGPKDTPYQGGIFTLTMKFTDDFPKQPPEVRFKNKIYHINVNSNGHVCINTLNNWREDPSNKTRICTVLTHIFALFHMQNPDDAYVTHLEEYKNKRESFNKKAREWTQKYANIDCVD